MEWDRDADLEASWPSDLIADELRSVLGSADPRLKTELVLREAFAGPVLADQFERTGDYDIALAAMRAAEGNLLRQHRGPRARWRQRRGDTSVTKPAIDVRAQIAELVSNLEADGYLDQACPKECVDESGWVGPTLEERIGRELPLDGDPVARAILRFDDGELFDFLEIVHELVSRPRQRWFHSFSGCGWHYSDFAVEPGRRLYRWRLNGLLEASSMPVRIADEGEDVGLIVDASAPRLEGLITDMRLQLAGERLRDIDHAVALFRSRGAGRQEKRSAVVALAGVLEARREELREHLLSKDEGALFEIANRFDLRHRNADQRGAYDTEFLDWVFWWYLATIRLVERISQRGED